MTDGWISVEERRPTLMDPPVLCVCNCDDCSITTYWIQHYDDTDPDPHWFAAAHYSNVPGDCLDNQCCQRVSHWMPLPPAPKPATEAGTP